MAALVAAGLAFALFVTGRLADGLPHALLSPWAVQYLLVLVAAGAVSLIARSWRTALAIGAAAIWPAVLVLPMIGPHASSQPGAGTPLRVVVMNVLASNTTTESAMHWCADIKPDLVAIVECTPAWLAAAESLTAELPYRTAAPRNDPGGIALLSRHPLRDARITRCDDGVFPFIEATVDSPAGPVRVFVIHPIPPTSRRYVASRNAEIARHAARVGALTGPRIVVGDLNETPFGRALHAFTNESGLISARDVGGLTPTWPARLFGVRVPAVFQIPIDHCFVSRDLHVAACRRGPDIGSDHMPLLVDLLVPLDEQRNASSGSQPAAKPLRRREQG